MVAKKVTKAQIEKELKLICKFFGLEFVSTEWWENSIYWEGEFLVCVEETSTVSGRLPKINKNRTYTAFELKKHLWASLDYTLGEAEDVIVALAK